MEKCPRFGCEELANTFIAVIVKTDEVKKKECLQQYNLGSPMVMCRRHAEERKDYFTELKRDSKIIQEFYSSPPATTSI